MRRSEPNTSPVEDRHEAQFVDDQQAEAGQIPLQVEQSPLVPGFQRSALPSRHGRDAPARFPSTIPQPEVLAGNSPVYSQGCKFIPPVADGAAGNSGCTTPGRKPDSRYSRWPLMPISGHLVVLTNRAISWACLGCVASLEPLSFWECRPQA